MTWLWIWNFKGGRYIFIVFTALPASPPLKNHTSVPDIQWLGYGFGIFKGGRYIFMVCTALPASTPLKNHKCPRYTMTPLWHNLTIVWFCHILSLSCMTPTLYNSVFSWAKSIKIPFWNIPISTPPLRLSKTLQSDVGGRGNMEYSQKFLTQPPPWNSIINSGVIKKHGEPNFHKSHG